MSKFGVGVGDDFPVDDGHGNAGAAGQGADANPSSNPDADRAEFEEWKRRRDAHRAQRQAYREQREEWRARKRAFKEKVHAAARESFGRDDFVDDDHPHGSWRGYGWRRSRFPFFLVPFFGLLIPIVIVAVLISIVAAIFKSPFVFLGLAILAFLYFAHRHHEWDRRHRDYDLDLKARPMSPPPPAT
jgi:Flp pilus assembly protein TadB